MKIELIFNKSQSEKILKGLELLSKAEPSEEVTEMLEEYRKDHAVTFDPKNWKTCPTCGHETISAANYCGMCRYCFLAEPAQ
jgi:hypothetical protein